MKKKTVIKFGDAEIEQQKFYQYKKSISIKNIAINKIVASNKISFVKKDFKILLAIRMLKK